MPTDRLRPTSTTGNLNTTTWRGAFPALPPNAVHEVISDQDDTSYARGQVSNSQPQTNAQGDLQDLTSGAGVVTGMVITIRGFRSTNGGDGVTLFAGDTLVNSRVSGNPLGATPANFVSGTLTPYTLASQINAMQWFMGVLWGSGTGPDGDINELYYDVTWNPITGALRGAMFCLVGALLGGAIGLHEMPAIAAAVHAASPTHLTIHPHEYSAAWRELREDRGRRYVFLA